MTSHQKKKRKNKEHDDEEEDFIPTAIAGYTDKLVGTFKEGVGKLLGDEDWVADGEKQKERGEKEIKVAVKSDKRNK